MGRLGPARGGHVPAGAGNRNRTLFPRHTRSGDRASREWPGTAQIFLLPRCRVNPEDRRNGVRVVNVVEG